jgi:hypothetical protein
MLARKMTEDFKAQFSNLVHGRAALSDAHHFHDLFAFVHHSIQRQRYERCSPTPSRLLLCLRLSPITSKLAAHGDLMPKRVDHSIVH